MGFGAFANEFTFNDACGCVVETLTFADGSTLVLDETGGSHTGPGNSGSTGAPSEGNPGSYGPFTWTVAGGTGTFAGATGTGSENFLSAGLVATGTLSGTITTAS